MAPGKITAEQTGAVIVFSDESGLSLLPTVRRTWALAGRTPTIGMRMGHRPKVSVVGWCHYFAHDAWLEDGRLLREAHRLAGIPGVLIHGRLDLGSPLKTAWELAKAWPDAELKVIDDSGHTGSTTMQDAITEATERFGVNGHGLTRS